MKLKKNSRVKDKQKTDTSALASVFVFALPHFQCMNHDSGGGGVSTAANLWHSMQHCAVKKKQVTFLLNLYV